MAFGPKPWKDKPDGTTPVTAAAMIDLETRLSNYTDAEVATAKADARGLVSSGATLPEPEYEGQQFDVVWADGLYRRCTWRGAANGGLGAWVVAGGGPPLVARDEGTNRTTSSLTWMAIAGLPSITIPHKGLWRLEWSAMHYNTSATAWDLLTVDVLQIDSRSAREPAAVANGNQRMSRSRGEHIALAAGALTMRARVTAGTATFVDIDLIAHPVELRP